MIIHHACNMTRTSLAHHSVFLTILLLMKSIKKVFSLLYISLLISTTFTCNQDQLGFTITNNRTGLGYLKTWQKCDTDKLNNAMDDIATSMWVIPIGLVGQYNLRSVSVIHRRA